MITHMVMKDDRNKKIIEDYKKGISVIRLVDKYRISSQAIYKILKLYGII